jgi:hypothetical protein
MSVTAAAAAAAGTFGINCYLDETVISPSVTASERLASSRIG